MESSVADQTPRLILYHKQATSGRTRFLRLADGGICAPARLPPGATQAKDRPSVSEHPAEIVNRICATLGIARADLELEAGFCVPVEVGAEILSVHLGRFTTVDPPFDAARRTESQFAALTEFRGLSEIELGLLRQAYEWVMG